MKHISSDYVCGSSKMNAITISFVFTGLAKGWSHVHVESKQNISARLVFLYVWEISHDPVLEFGRVNTSSQDCSKLFQLVVVQICYDCQLEHWCHKGIHAASSMWDTSSPRAMSWLISSRLSKVIFVSLALFGKPNTSDGTGHPAPSYVRVAMAEWLAHRTPNHKIMGSSPTKTSWLIKNRPVWVTGVSVHSAINENLRL